MLVEEKDYWQYMNRSRTIFGSDNTFHFSMNTLQIECSSKIEQMLSLNGLLCFSYSIIYRCKSSNV